MSNRTHSNTATRPQPPPQSGPFTINMNGDGNSTNGASNGPTYRPNSPFSSEFGQSVHNNARTKHALGENDFMHSTGATLDSYIAQGQAVLGNLAMQRDMLKGQSSSSSLPTSPSASLPHFPISLGVPAYLSAWIADHRKPTQGRSGDCFLPPTRLASRARRSSTLNGGPRATSTS